MKNEKVKKNIPKEINYQICIISTFHIVNKSMPHQLLPPPPIPFFQRNFFFDFSRLKPEIPSPIIIKIFPFPNFPFAHPSQKKRKKKKL